MKIVYLAPEIPALSATFVYNELLALESLGHNIVPVSVLKPSSPACDERLMELKKRVFHLYSQTKWAVLTSHFRMLLKQPTSYFYALSLLLKDIVVLGVMRRDALGLCYRFFYAVLLSEKLMSEHVEHVHVHFAHVPTDIAMYATAIAKIPFSTMAHANDIFERSLLIKQKVQRSLFFATISDFNRRYIENTFKAERDKLKVIRCGVDTDVFSPKLHRAITNPVKLGAVGRLVEKKGFDTLLKAVAILKKSDTNVTVEIAGSGPLQSKLESLIAELNLTEIVKFVGALSHDKVASFVQQLDIFVLPCKQDSNGDMDGIPVVLMEAMMVGTPVISSRISGIPELVIANQTGLLIEQDNAQQLASKIVEFVNGESQRETMIQNAIEHVRTEFSQLGNAELLESLLLTKSTL